MLKILGAVFASTCFVGGAAQATILPPNTLHLEDTILQSNITEEEFSEAIDKAEAVYAPIIEDSFGGRLVMNKRWSDNTVNASKFFKLVGKYVRSLARRPEVTLDGYLVICHEIGHHVAGYPFSSSGGK